MSNHAARPVALATIVLSLVTVACSGFPPGGTPGPAQGPASPSPDATTGIDHPTGATDVVLRVSSGGGFMIAGFAAVEAPSFTLYGNGTVVFRDPTAAPPAPPANSSIIPGLPFKTARLDEAQVQALLQSALGESGLGIARPRYDLPTVADGPTTTFEVHAGGLDKTVEVYALGLEDPTSPDAAARKAFAALADKLAKFDQGGVFATQPYIPAAYRGVLMSADGIVANDIRQWPWGSLKPEDFTITSDPTVPSLPIRTFTPDELAPLDLPDLEGGAQGIYLQGPGDGKVYNLALRPLLPDETE